MPYVSFLAGTEYNLVNRDFIFYKGHQLTLPYF